MNDHKCWNNSSPIRLREPHHGHTDLIEYPSLVGLKVRYCIHNTNLYVFFPPLDSSTTLKWRHHTRHQRTIFGPFWTCFSDGRGPTTIFGIFKNPERAPLTLLKRQRSAYLGPTGWRNLTPLYGLRWRPTPDPGRRTIVTRWKSTISTQFRP